MSTTVDVLRAAWALLGEVTPLAVDCGQVCDGRRCRPSADSVGMRLFPGEETLLADSGFALTPADGGVLLTCDGHCRRELRPLMCRIFPLFPYVDARGRMRAVYDPRSYRLCPLTQHVDNVRLQPAFVRAVRRVGRVLLADEACAAFLREQSRELEDLWRLLPLNDDRPPIARRKRREKECSR